jgi:hypothetical protein
MRLLENLQQQELQLDKPQRNLLLQLVTRLQLSPH